MVRSTVVNFADVLSKQNIKLHLSTINTVKSVSDGVLQQWKVIFIYIYIIYIFFNVINILFEYLDLDCHSFLSTTLFIVYTDECSSPTPVTMDNVDTPAPVNVTKRKCVVRLRNENLDALGFTTPNTKSRAQSRGHLLFTHSPPKNDRPGRVYQLESDRLKSRVEQIDQNRVGKYGVVSSFRKIAYTPPKSLSRQIKSVRREIESELEATEPATTTPAPSVVKDPRPRSRGVYVSMIDPYMIGSTDLVEAMEFIQQVVSSVWKTITRWKCVWWTLA